MCCYPPNLHVVTHSFPTRRSSDLELCVIAEELGRAVVATPFSSSVYLASEAVKLYGTEKQKEAWLPKLAAGEIIGTVAVSEGTHAASPRNVQKIGRAHV